MFRASRPRCGHSLVELLDLFPTTASLCGLEVPRRLQGRDISTLLDDPREEVRNAAFSVAPMRKGFLLRERRMAYIQYSENASDGVELFDCVADPQQFTNLAGDPRYAKTVTRFQEQLAARLAEIRDNDL